MDIQHLVDRLEDLIDEGRHVPMSRYTLIDEERALEIIDQMRISIPEQIEKATRVVNQRDRILSQANEEANRMVELARDKSEELVSRDAIMTKAQTRSESLLAQARLDAERTRDEADGYVMDVLKDLENQLLRTLTIVRNGIAKLVQDREIRTQNIQYLQQQAQQASLQSQATMTPAQPIADAAPPTDDDQPAVQVDQDQYVDAE